MADHPTAHELHYRYVKHGISLSLAFFLLFLSSCTKETGSLPPSLIFLTGSGFVSHDTALSIGQTIHVGIEARGEGASITYFHVGLDNGLPQTMLDSGMNQQTFRYETSITKTASPSERWEFLVMDRNRRFNSIVMTLFRDTTSQYMPIKAIPDVLLGAQSNPSAGSFFSIGANHRYFLDEAYLVQDSIDMIYYFDKYDATLSSPAEADALTVFPGPTGLANWMVKNETRYDTTGIAPAAFLLSANDSLILAAYEPANLKRKAKYIQPGMVISFRNPVGKLGLIYVKEVVQGTAGHVLMDVKIQQ